MRTACRQRQRVQRVREIEHKAAMVRLGQADHALANLGHIARRLGELKQPLSARLGVSQGQTLHAMAEMSQRIDDAHASLVRPTDDALRNRSRLDAERKMAKLRERGIGQLIERALQAVESEHDLRADADRPRGKPVGFSGGGR